MAQRRQPGMAPGCRTAEGAKPWVVARNSKGGRQTSGSLDAAENVAFSVGELCSPRGFLRKKTFQDWQALGLRLMPGLVAGLWLSHGLWLRHGLRSRHGLELLLLSWASKILVRSATSVINPLRSIDAPACQNHVNLRAARRNLCSDSIC